MRKLNPETAARDVANIFCSAYVSKQNSPSLDSADIQKAASVIYASAYDTAYDYISSENKLVSETD